MDVFDPFLHVAVRSLVVLFPMTVGWLAFRRLALSQSANAWIYAAMCLLAAATSAAVLPWTLGIAALNWFTLILALSCPALWLAVVALCDVASSSRYGPDPVEIAARRMWGNLASSPTAGRGDAAGPAVPVFRHQAPQEDVPAAPRKAYSTATRTLLSLTRDIRNNPTSERHRPRLLPAPDMRELAFLRRAPRS